MEQSAIQFEEWRDIPGYAGYKVSNLGRVRGKTGVIIYQKLIKKPWQKNGYLEVNLWYGARKRIHLYVHRAVMMAFIGLPPSSEHVVRHLNCDSTDNRLCNLAWGTKQENASDSLRVYGPPIKKGEHRGERKSANRKLTFEIAQNIRIDTRGNKTLAKIYGVGVGTVRSIRRNESYIIP